MRGPGLIVSLLLGALAAAHALAESEHTLVRRTTLVVADIETSIRFYRHVLGFERWYYAEGTVQEGSLPAEAEIGDPNLFAIMKGRDSWIGMVGLLQKGPARAAAVDVASFRVRPGDTILMLETDDLENIYRRMLEAGTPIWKHPETTTVTGAGGRQWQATFLFAFDPDGHLLEINEPQFESATPRIRRAYADTRSGQLHYRYTPDADGVPLVLLHQTPLSGRMYRHLLPALAAERQAFAADGSHLTAMWASTYSSRAPGQTLEMVAATVAEKQRAGEDEWWALGALARYDLAADLGRLHVPAAFVSPGDGLAERTRRAAALARRDLLVERPAWGHGIFDTEAQSINNLINQLLELLNKNSD